MKSLFTIHSII